MPALHSTRPTRLTFTSRASPHYAEALLQDPAGQPVDVVRRIRDDIDRIRDDIDARVQALLAELVPAGA